MFTARSQVFLLQKRGALYSVPSLLSMVSRTGAIYYCPGILITVDTD